MSNKFEGLFQFTKNNDEPWDWHINKFMFAVYIPNQKVYRVKGYPSMYQSPDNLISRAYNFTLKINYI